MRLFLQTQGSGPDIVLLHGWGLHSGIWADVATALAPHNRVTRIDLPGHGRNAGTAMAEHLSAVAAQIAAVAPAPAIWIGWSLGGLIALQLALSAPAAVRGLVVVAGSPRFVRDTDWPYAVEDAVLQQFARSLDEDYAATLGRFLALLKEKNPAIQIIGVQPNEGSRIPGIRKWPQEYLPKIYNPANVDELMYVSQEDAEDMCRRLAREEGIFAGISAAGACWVAQEIAKREANATIVFVVCDRGDRYLSTGVFPA